MPFLFYEKADEALKYSKSAILVFVRSKLSLGLAHYLWRPDTPLGGRLYFPCHRPGWSSLSRRSAVQGLYNLSLFVGFPHHTWQNNSTMESTPWNHRVLKRGKALQCSELVFIFIFIFDTSGKVMTSQKWFFFSKVNAGKRTSGVESDSVCNHTSDYNFREAQEIKIILMK